jgi:hypothetical protein
VKIREVCKKHPPPSTEHKFAKVQLLTDEIHEGSETEHQAATSKSPVNHLPDARLNRKEERKEKKADCVNTSMD